MIKKLIGKIDSIKDNELLLNVNNICYQIFISKKFANNIINNFAGNYIGKEIAVNISMIVREEYIHLYGFESDNDENMFLELSKIKSVSHKIALNIMGELEIDEIINTVITKNINIFTQIPKIGKKLSERIIIELKDKINKFNYNKNNISNNINNNSQLLSEGLSALNNLGFKEQKIYKILSDILNDNKNITLEELIKKSLKIINEK